MLRRKRYFANNYYYHLKNNLFVCLFEKVDQEQQLTIKRNSDELAISVESECKRPSASRLSGGGQMSIEKGMGATASTTLSAAVAALIHGEGLQFSLVQSQLLSRVIVAGYFITYSTEFHSVRTKQITYEALKWVWSRRKRKTEGAIH